MDMKDNAILQINNISKYYAGTCAIDDVSLDIPEGKIIGLIGENGAGKSTLLKIIMGTERPSSGSMLIRGETYAPLTPREANDSGVGMVFQEQSLIASLNVAQNLYLGREDEFRKYGIMDWKKLYKDVEAFLASIGMSHIHAKTKVSSLNFMQRQMVEIARVLNLVRNSSHERSLILLDEPTSVLNNEEVDQLFSYMRKLKESGHSVVFVSHRLDEVIEISDLIYVFCDGKKVGEVTKEEARENVLYEMMVGKSSPDEYYHLDRQTPQGSKVVLELKDVGRLGAFRNVSFSLHEGEILGICGVMGSGKEDVCNVICGDEKKSSGEILLNGKYVDFKSPAQALQEGILCIPKERRIEGIVETLSIEDNIILSNFDAAAEGGRISQKKQMAIAEEWIERLNIKCSGRREKTEQLSGGNAQKVVFARALCSKASILILNHPTRGVDVGAKVEIYGLIRDIVKTGISIILLGDTLEECVGLSSRLIVMKDGEIKKVFDASPDKKPTNFEIIQYMM